VAADHNRKLLAGNGVVVYLRAVVADLWQRTRHDRSRPLLKTAEPRAKLEQLFAERDPLYRSVADIIVDTGSQSLGSLAHRLEQLLIERQSAAAEGAGAPLRAG